MMNNWTPFRLGLGVILVSVCGAIAETAPKPYNVLFISIDDLRPELNCYGADHIISPNIDRLAENGVQFSNAYVLTINKFFKQNGYTISSCGKIYHHGVDSKKQFGSDEMVPVETWEGFGYVTEEAIKQQGLNTRTGRGPAYECADVEDTLYKDGINTFNAVNKLAELKESAQF